MLKPGRLFTSARPPVVGREALLEDATDDFLRELTRQKPWLHARYEGLLGGLDAYLSARLNRPAPLTALSCETVAAWKRTLSAVQRPLAERALEDFADYLVKWGWLEAHFLRQPHAV